jgi:hypothetical protein
MLHPWSLPDALIAEWRDKRVNLARFVTIFRVNFTSIFFPMEAHKRVHRFS